MQNKKIIYYTAIVFWLISTAYFIYKYSLDAGYWKNPLLISLFFYIVIIFVKRRLNLLIIGIGLFYPGFVLWFINDLLQSLNDIFG